MSAPILSIITPCYQADRFIKVCLDNVIQQECNLIEHLIIDGGSKDTTTTILRDYASRYPHIKWLSEPDQGQSDAMNKGLSMAQADIIGFLNVDDYYEPNTLQEVVASYSNFKENTIIIGKCNIRNHSHQIINVSTPHTPTLLDLTLGIYPPNPSAYFYHKSIHDRIGPFELDQHLLMDWDFFLKAYPHLDWIISDDTWGNYYQHDECKTIISFTKTHSSHKRKELLAPYVSKLNVIQKLKYHALNFIEALQQIFHRITGWLQRNLSHS